ncbi:MAG: ABC transporter ATP-binding protein [Bacilli bacterium]|nr:ABC transporter ATP-binding protein [Bacilli bacterium]
MIKILKSLNKKDYLIVLVSFMLIIFQVWLDLKLPDYMSEITRLVQSENATVSDIMRQGFYMLSCAFGSLISAIIVGYLTSKLSATLSYKIRERLFKKVNEFNMEEMKNFKTSSLITRTTNDITNITMFFSMGLQLIIKAPITAIWAILKILNKNFTWSMLTGGAVLILITMVVVLIITVLPKFKVVQKLIDNINNVARENLTGIRVIRAFNAEDFQTTKFEDANDNLTKTQMFTQKMMSIISPVMYLVMNMLTILIYFVGAYLIENALLADKINLFSDMVVFSSYAMQVIMSFLMLAVIFIMYPRTSVSISRINEVLDTDVKVKDGTFDSDTKELGVVEFRNVSFKYPDSEEYVLKDISFKTKLGETIAFIGSTGSGKSTLINLIPRFYDATEGEILVDGIPIKDYKLDRLHSKMGYVSQKAVLFNGTVKYNVCYGLDSKEEKLEDAIKVSQASEFISKMTDKTDSMISQGGTNISGGQKQRISIARAICKDPEFYIFDDSFSALDYKTDYLLRHELSKYAKDATVFIVAQRIGTIMNADKIIVLDNGNVVGSGTHKELLKNCSVYKEIAYSQLSKEELENEG